MPLKSVVSRNIKVLRMQSGMTQKELAEGAGINPRYVGFIERGAKSNLTLDMLESIAGALDVTVFELMHDDKSRRNPSSELRRQLDHLKKEAEKLQLQIEKCRKLAPL